MADPLGRGRESGDEQKQQQQRLHRFACETMPFLPLVLFPPLLFVTEAPAPAP